MKKLITYVLMALLNTAALSSCSVEMFDPDGDSIGDAGHREMVITGLVTDLEGDKVLEDITIRFDAYLQANPGRPVITDEVHTGNQGMFTIQASYADSGNLMCILTAEDPKGIYQSLSKQIIITWTGTSYDKKLQMYVVNDCNFQLRKAE